MKFTPLLLEATPEEKKKEKEKRKLKNTLQDETESMDKCLLPQQDTHGLFKDAFAGSQATNKKIKEKKKIKRHVWG